VPRLVHAASLLSALVLAPAVTLSIAVERGGDARIPIDSFDCVPRGTAAR
jgi:hypothetical protein